MNAPLIIINALIPLLGMISGLSVAFTVPICFAVMLWQMRGAKFNKISIYQSAVIFIVWCFCSCFWSIDPIQSLKLFLRVFGLVLTCLILMKNINYLQGNILSGLIVGMNIAIIYFFIEYTTDGVITNSFRGLFSANNFSEFHLYNLDRGCAILALSAWIVICLSCYSKQYFLALFNYVIIFYILSISESLASFVGFALSTIIFILVRSHPRFFINFIKYGVIIGSLTMPIIAYKMDPKMVADNYSMPLSAKHRLFIWHYVAKKVAEKPIFGYGFGGSRQLSMNNEEFINYDNQKLSLLPLHPHNNIMQILLETGIVGLLLFLSIIYQFFSAINKKIYLSETSRLEIAAVVACFINYYVIGMISYSIWQLWWVCIGAWLILAFKWLNATVNSKT